MRDPIPPTSCPRRDTPPRYAAGTPSSRASTSFLRHLSKQDVDGRDKPGHDSGKLARFYSSRFFSKAHYLADRSVCEEVRLTSQREHMQHDCIALLSEFRRIDKPRSGCRARSRDDRDILLAIDFERHRRRGKARTDVDLPQFVERGVIERRNCTVQ